MKAKDNPYPPEEANRRRDAVLRAMLARPPEKHQTLRAQKRKRRLAKNGASQNAKENIC
jgi:hypothetical protein